MNMTVAHNRRIRKFQNFRRGLCATIFVFPTDLCTAEKDYHYFVEQKMSHRTVKNFQRAREIFWSVKIFEKAKTSVEFDHILK